MNFEQVHINTGEILGQMTPCQWNRVNEAVPHGGIRQSNLFGLQVSIFWQLIFFFSLQSFMFKVYFLIYCSRQ